MSKCRPGGKIELSNKDIKKIERIIEKILKDNVKKK